MLEFKGEQQLDSNKFFEEQIENKMVTLTSETLSSEDCFETKLQTKFDKSDEIFEQPEEELMNFIEQQNQESEQTEEELDTLNSKTPCISEATEAINAMSINIPSQLLSTKTTTSFDKDFDQLSMNNSFEAAKFEPEPTFEKTISEIKDNNLEIIASATTNTSAITSFDKNFDPLCIKNSF